MKNKIYSLLLIIFFITISQGQTNTDLRPVVKSPEVNKFEQYMNMPVNLVSGTPQVSIPIYTLEYGGMTLPISLEYDASGVKVESIASSVGQNWSLNVGGAVSRIVKGAVDEGPNNGVVFPKSDFAIDGFYRNKGLTNLNSELLKYNANLYDVTGPDWYSKSSLKAEKYYTWINDLVSGLKDSQPDLFYFSTPEGGSKFIFNNNQEVVYLENTDFVIKENFVTNFFKTWNVKSPNGINYKFGLDTGLSDGSNNAIEMSATLRGLSETTFNYTTSSWLLSEISNSINDRKIQINYIDNNYKHTIINNPNHNTWGQVPNYTYPLIPPGWDSSQSPEILYNAYGSNPYNVLSEVYNTNSYGNGVFNINSLDYPSYIQLPKDFCNNIKSKVIRKIIAGDIEINFNYSTRDDILTNLSLGSSAQKLDNIQILNKGVFIKKITFNYSYAFSNEATNNVNVLAYDQKRLFLNKITENADGAISKSYEFIYNLTNLPNKLSYGQDKWGYYNGKISNNTIYTKRISSDEILFADRKADINYAKAGSLEKIIYPTKGTVNFGYESHSSYNLDELHSTAVDSTYNPIPSRILISDLQPQPPLSLQSIPQYPYNSKSFIYDLADSQILQLDINMFYPKYNGPSKEWCDTQGGLGIAVDIVDATNNTQIYAIMYKNKASGSVSNRIDPSRFIKGRTYVLRTYGGECYHNMTSLKVHDIMPIYEVGGLRLNKITHKDYNGTIVKESSYSYHFPKLLSNPKPFHKINFNFTDANLKLSNIDPNLNSFALHLNSLINYPGTSTTKFNSGYYYFISSKSDPFDIDFMGPQISYSKVIETDGNGNTINEFNEYNTYKELMNSGERISFPAPPKMQSILGGSKKTVTSTNSSGVTVDVKNTNYNYVKQNTTVNALNVSKFNLGVMTNVYTIQGQIKTLKTETETTKLSGQDVTTTKDYEYRTDNKHFRPLKITTTDNAGSQKLITKMYYPDDMGTEPFMSNLLAQNRKATPIKVETFRGTTALTDKIAEQRIVYANDATTGNLLLTKSIYAAKFPNFITPITTPNVGALERRVTSDLYDTSGNLLQFTPESGVPVALIWGYSKTQPIAKIENATYAQVEALSGFGAGFTIVTALTAAQETTLRTSLTGAMITTYTYIPLVGVSTITDPKGDMITYSYDALGRLQNVKDKKGNILSQNQYHYKN